jgi:hypothetical protein
MREVREQASRGCRGLHLLVRMYVLQNLRGGNAKYLSELRWRAGKQTAQEAIDAPLKFVVSSVGGNVFREGKTKECERRSASIRRVSDPADVCMVFHSNLFAPESPF